MLPGSDHNDKKYATYVQKVDPPYKISLETLVASSFTEGVLMRIFILQELLSVGVCYPPNWNIKILEEVQEKLKLFFF